MRQFIKKEHSESNVTRKIINNSYIKKTFGKLKVLILFLCVAFLCTSILIFSSASADGVTKGLIFSSEILIPSLFPFMVLSTFVVKSSLSFKLGKIIGGLTRSLFKLPGSTGATIFLSLIGGYPTGAQGIKNLVSKNEITPSQARRMLCFAVGAGPAFVINVVGSEFLGSLQVGIILFASQVISSILIGISLGLFSQKNIKNKLCQMKKKDNSVLNISSALVESCYDSTISTINMCAFVVIFSAIISIMNNCGISSFISNCFLKFGIPENISKAILPSILEVTSGCLEGAKYSVPIEFIAFAISFAGVCVHFQISSTLKDFAFSKSIFTLFRIIHGLLSAMLTHICLILFPQTHTVINTVSSKLNFSFSSHAEGSIALVLLCVSFLVSLSCSKNDFIYFGKNST